LEPPNKLIPTPIIHRVNFLVPTFSIELQQVTRLFPPDITSKHSGLYALSAESLGDSADLKAAPVPALGGGPLKLAKALAQFQLGIRPYHLCPPLE
jgi:hypothetical protein